MVANVHFCIPVCLIPEAPTYSWLKKTKADAKLIGIEKGECIEFWLETKWRTLPLEPEQRFLGKCRTLDLLHYPIDILLNVLSHYWFNHSTAIIPHTPYEDYLEELMLLHRYRNFGAIHQFLQYQTEFLARVMRVLFSSFNHVNFVYEVPASNNQPHV
jgi:hypothetical protein